MKNDDQRSNYHGIGLLDIIFIVFLILKLTNNITWSWHVVLLPIYIQIGICLCIIVFAAIRRK